MDEKYDAALLGIIQNEGKIENFLHAILGFLYRRTDFFRILKSKEDKMGFAPGVAFSMLTQIFQYYDDMARKSESMRMKKSEAAKPKSETMRKESVATPKTDVISGAGPSGRDSFSTEPDNQKVDEAGKPSCDTSESCHDKTVDNKNNCDLSAAPKCDSSDNQIIDKTVSGELSGDNTSKQSQEASSEADKASKTIDPKTGEEDDNPELTRQQQIFQSNPDSYNGAVRDNYSWSQSIGDLDLKVKVPSFIRKGRDVKVDIGRKHIKVQHKNEAGQWCVVMDGDLTWEVRTDDSMWSLNPGENVHVNFEKKDERWWEAVLVDEPKISVRKIDASRPMTDLDDEAQAKIEEMMYNDRQKKLGLPQSHEQKMHDMLRNAWDAEGSPFKGQQFDPSKFHVDPSGMMSMKPS